MRPLLILMSVFNYKINGRGPRTKESSQARRPLAAAWENDGKSLKVVRVWWWRCNGSIFLCWCCRDGHPMNVVNTWSALLLMQMRLGLCPIFDKKKKGVQQRYYHYFDKLCSSNENSIPCIANITWWLSDLSGYQHTDLLMKHKRYFCYFAETQKAMRSGKLQQISNNNAYLSWREHCIWYLWIWRCLTVWKIRAVTVSGFCRWRSSHSQVKCWNWTHSSMCTSKNRTYWCISWIKADCHARGRVHEWIYEGFKRRK